MRISDWSSDVCSSDLGKNQLWRSASSSTISALATVGSQSWTVVGIGDFNGDGSTDILWRDTADGRNAIWLSGNASTKQATTGVSEFWCTVTGAGDFDGDGTAVLCLRVPAAGRTPIVTG